MEKSLFPKKVYLVGAHGGYRLLDAPLGGGATIFESLIAEWKDRPDIAMSILSPGSEYPLLQSYLKRHWSGGIDLSSHHPASLGYLDYARFSRAFEYATTDFLLGQDGQNSWVIANDICEGPDFVRLRQHGYKIATLVHVDVVEFITTMYLKRCIPSHFLTSVWRRLGKIGMTLCFHDIAKLIFDKQESAYHYSNLIIVPSAPMKDVILRCYPDVESLKIKVVPWGCPTSDFSPKTDIDVNAYKEKWGIQKGSFVILSLSRISPEKGIDRVIKGLIELEREHPELAKRCCFLLAGSAAYMDGPRYMRKLKNLARKLKLVKVIFTGHLVRDSKLAAFRISNLYAFLSYHESYGLTLSEALQHGVPALVSDEASRGSVRVPGVMVCDATPLGISVKLRKILEKGPDSVPQETEKMFRESSNHIFELMK